jgi:hypothetical protein
MATKEQLIEKAETITRALRPHLTRALGGQPVEVQGMVLADLLARWLTGHIVLGNPAATTMLREDLLAVQLNTVRELVEMYGQP